jgi:hypothetical protein
MLGKDSNWLTDGMPLIGHMRIGQPFEGQQTEERQTRRWPIAVMTATYRYLSEGVRILGKSHSVYDEHSPQ